MDSATVDMVLDPVLESELREILDEPKRCELVVDDEGEEECGQPARWIAILRCSGCGEIDDILICQECHEQFTVPELIKMVPLR